MSLAASAIPRGGGFGNFLWRWFELSVGLSIRFGRNYFRRRSHRRGRITGLHSGDWRNCDLSSDRHDTLNLRDLFFWQLHLRHRLGSRGYASLAYDLANGENGDKTFHLKVHDVRKGTLRVRDLRLRSWRTPRLKPNLPTGQRHNGVQPILDDLGHSVLLTESESSEPRPWCCRCRCRGRCSSRTRSGRLPA